MNSFPDFSMWISNSSSLSKMIGKTKKKQFLPSRMAWTSYQRILVFFLLKQFLNSTKRSFTHSSLDCPSTLKSMRRALAITIPLVPIRTSPELQWTTTPNTWCQHPQSQHLWAIFTMQCPITNLLTSMDWHKATIVSQWSTWCRRENQTLSF